MGGIIEVLLGFMDKGGDVLWLIAALLFVMWTLIFERIWYLQFGWKNDVAQVIGKWEGRSERKSWEAEQIRAMLVSQARMQINRNLPVIKTLVALCPLLGLLGTVTGMIEVFNIMAVTGGGDAKSMAGGVQQATIPTMAGMVAALSGVFANTYVTRIAQRESIFLRDNLTTDH
ncbi:transporter, MotA/TolQ/ExbB proton channel family, putative [marine gamma proteobacterium HTCC2148]|jgi:biopolymer transport protein ExbB|nr:transporter, MotA/TolQ/ExbB proton channel family, putative [marine gamma proteobacterium HTCC2148]MBT3409143.1 MotA/TolQ/ExbB proton channel family protein [Halieaceae bacterium]MBT5006522.1 MotA/TolQ/ExbB proton channel family protein [Halieaceae bacterium]MBT6123581.1 MotA/TolQ/ExbB proton channel family protein [Halieaceae bacterium]MBT7719854.1 MotA/TolQ/ExbB proton channel family protein [Halieaceae bacterium]